MHDTIKNKHILCRYLEEKVISPCGFVLRIDANNYRSNHRGDLFRPCGSLAHHS
jgi:hypothetical protein